jgi:hypothetical protein
MVSAEIPPPPTRLHPSPGSAPMSEEDLAITQVVDRYLGRGLALKRWFDRGHGGGEFAERFGLAFTYNRPDASYGFFDSAVVDGAEMPVMGNFQTMFYDQPKSGTAPGSEGAEHINDQIREFVLRYFMRVSSFRDPQPYTEGEPSPPLLLRPFSWCTGRDVRRIGFGFSQLYYKRRGGEIGKFPEAERYSIIDLRRLGSELEWIVARVKIFDFSFSTSLFGAGTPTFTVPLQEDSLLVLNRDFIEDERRPRDAEIGRYGLGYAFIKNPVPKLVAWGPGKFDAAMQTIRFHVLADGRIRVDMAFVANRPTAIASVPVDPVLLGLETADLVTGGLSAPYTLPLRLIAARGPLGQVRVDPVIAFINVANLATAGMAARQLCISRQEVDRQLILLHFNKHYQALAGSLQTWRQIRDWLDESSLPRWVVTGEAT